jgi:hypothetical protein
MTEKRALPILAAVALTAGAGALAYGWLAGLPPSPMVDFGQFVRNVEAGQVATVVLRDTTFTVVDRQGKTYQVVAADPPGLNATYLSYLQEAAAAGGQTFDAANYREEAPRDTAWIGPFVLAVALFVLLAGYVFYVTGPEPRAGPTHDIQ